ncbi:hypothetical protein [Nostoc parmelioides]|nr:hypothetical protein [Nostoc parmelioides]
MFQNLNAVWMIAIADSLYFVEYAIAPSILRCLLLGGLSLTFGLDMKMG